MDAINNYKLLTMPPNASPAANHEIKHDKRHSFQSTTYTDLVKEKSLDFYTMQTQTYENYNISAPPITKQHVFYNYRLTRSQNEPANARKTHLLDPYFYSNLLKQNSLTPKKQQSFLLHSHLPRKKILTQFTQKQAQPKNLKIGF